MLVQMQGHESANDAGIALDLPVAGEQLSNLVSVLLKTNEEEDPKSMASFVHQARVRRDVVWASFEAHRPVATEVTGMWTWIACGPMRNAFQRTACHQKLCGFCHTMATSTRS